MRRECGRGLRLDLCNPHRASIRVSSSAGGGCCLAEKSSGGGGGGFGACASVLKSEAYRCRVRPESRQVGLNLPSRKILNQPTSPKQNNGLGLFLNNAAEFDISFIQNGKQACFSGQIGTGAEFRKKRKEKNLSWRSTPPLGSPATSPALARDLRGEASYLARPSTPRSSAPKPRAPSLPAPLGLKVTSRFLLPAAPPSRGRMM